MIDKDDLEELLELAGVAPTEREEARTWLVDALDRAHVVPPQQKTTTLGLALARFLDPDLTPNDADKHLEELKKLAENLLKQLKELRQRPYQHMAFWGCATFGEAKHQYLRNIDPTLPIGTETGLERGGVVQALQSVVVAAEKAKRRPRTNRPRKYRKRTLVKNAAYFWDRFSPHPFSGTKTGDFHHFAEAFYRVATGKEEDVERTVREIARQWKAGAARTGPSA